MLVSREENTGRTRAIGAALLASLLLAPAAEAYIGPGAGFAFVGSFFMLLWALVLGAFTLASYPVRLLWRALRRRSLLATAPRRVVVIGFDGMDPALAERWMAEGRLPSLAALAREGAFHRLRTTHPPLSPVAWSSFMTGVHPARHGIFDFLARDARSYLPFLSSSAVEPAKRSLAIGKFEVPLGRPRLRLFRKAPPFWKILGAHGVFSSVVRVPATFPADRFHGACLSGMSVPDLRGTQGSFTFFGEEARGGETTGGLRVALRREGDRLVGAIPGPAHPLRSDRGALEIPFTVDVVDGGADLTIDGGRIRLTPARHSEWISLRFDAGLGVKPCGIVRFRLASLEPFALYMTPIHIDPDRPALPISHPRYYASYLAKLLGPFATLGLAEDTWALNERALDEDGFLEQAYLFHEERERQLFDALDKTRSGVVVCVFDATDRIQHMFYRYGDADSRADRPGDRERYASAIQDIYRCCDDLIGRVRAALEPRTVLLVVSDHGFASFRRGVNLNAWFLREGYLALREGARGDAEFLRDVDWSRTRAYAVGLAGVYLNLRGRETRGVVSPGEEADRLLAEIAAKLERLRDPDGDRPVVVEAVNMARRYRGPYLDQSPDLVVGYADGYRVSWEAAVGKVAGEVISDNRKCWSGDHCVDPRLVPGVLFCNRPVEVEDPSIVDLAPTILDLYGVPAPSHMEGRSLRVSLPA